MLRGYLTEVDQELSEQYYSSRQDVLNRLTLQANGEAVYATCPIIMLLAYASRVPIYLVTDSESGFHIIDFKEFIDNFVEIRKAEGQNFPHYDWRPWRDEALVVFHHTSGAPLNIGAGNNHFGYFKRVPEKDIPKIEEAEPIYLGGGAWENAPF